MAMTREDFDVFFAHPMRPSKKFKIHKNEQKICYEKQKVGKSYVALMLPKLSEALGVERITNAQLRTTSIRKMKRGKVSDRDLMSLTGQKKLETLNHYALEPENSVKMEMVQAIFAGPNKPRVIVRAMPAPSSTVTSAEMNIATPQVIGERYLLFWHFSTNLDHFYIHHNYPFQERI